jgi:hypothetical protein
MWPCIVTNFLTIKPTRCTNFSIYFGNETLHVSDSSSVHHQELFTVHSAMMYVMQVCRQLSSRIVLILLLLESCLQTCMTYTIAELQWITPEDGQRNCPKHVEFHFQNKFKELVHLVRFSTRKIWFSEFLGPHLTYRNPRVGVVRGNYVCQEFVYYDRQLTHTLFQSEIWSFVTSNMLAQ